MQIAKFREYILVNSPRLYFVLCWAVLSLHAHTWHYTHIHDITRTLFSFLWEVITRALHPCVSLTCKTEPFFLVFESKNREKNGFFF